MSNTSDTAALKEIRPVAYIHNDYKEKFGIPRQAGINSLSVSSVELVKEYSDPSCIEGLELFSHIWLIFGFSSNADTGNLKVKPPRLGGNTKLGVFATRSPFRPNGLGLSCVRIKDIETSEGRIIINVYGADLMDGTPIYDIKPYLPEYDSMEEARNDLEGRMRDLKLYVHFPQQLLSSVPEEKREALLQLLENDPRPQYKRNKDERYAFRYAELDIRFEVRGGDLFVVDVVHADDTMKLIK